VYEKAGEKCYKGASQGETNVPHKANFYGYKQAYDQVLWGELSKENRIKALVYGRSL